jgi:uncharacterized protein YbjT (DUF2867 family)
MKIVVNTPTGNIGRALTARLLDSGNELVLLVRDPHKVQEFATRSCTILQGTLEDAAFVQEATRGADVLFWVTPPNYTADDFRAYQNHVGDIGVSAVRENRIPRVVNLSSAGAHLGTGTGPILGLHDIEAKMNDACENVSHLRPGMFMENHLAALPTIQAHKSIFLPVAGSTKQAFIATRDIATYAAQRVLDTSWSGESVTELYGPASISFDDAAAAISEAVGETIAHVPVTLAQTREALLGMGMSESTADTMVELYGSVESGHLTAAPGVAKQMTNTTFATFARDVIAPIVRGGAS